MLDLDQLETLQAEIGADGFAEVADLLVCEIADGITALGTQPTGADLSAQFHYLKGSALNLGFRDFAGLCAQGEQGLPVDTAALQQVFDASVLALQRWANP
ncbi:MAG: Hpt domain-containing protein [Rhodobacteraceae bacterium]|nr:Hpt domain-containing protein [Paracoccaceae bacterium]